MSTATTPTRGNPDGMERLPFLLPDFTRVLWVGEAARGLWEERLRAIGRAWFDIEWRAVVAGVRRCAVTVISPETLVERSATWLDHGLAALPFEIQGASDSYASTPVAPEPGKAFVFRCVVARPDDLRAFRAAWTASDDQAIGGLLGYPPCCTSFFRQVWVKQRLVDTTWPMALATVGAANGERVLTVTGPAEANILWRWMGPRAVPHLPCRFDCPDTVELGRRLIKVGGEAGYRDEMAWLQEILSWPVEWSALHGIAEVRTPILKVSTRTDATPAKYVVRREGTGYPAEGAKGLVFPYRTPVRPLLTATRAFRRGFAHDSSLLEAPPPWLATDNGFSTPAAMDAAHAPIVERARSVLGQGTGAPVIDLGCGNGALLGKLVAACGVVPFGIDADGGRIEHARLLLPKFADHLWVGDLLKSDAPWADGRRFAVALLMPGRLLEDVDPDDALRLRERLRTSCDQILVYAYGDWLTRYGSLQGLVEAAGLKLKSAQGAVGLAEIPEASQGATRRKEG